MNSLRKVGATPPCVDKRLELQKQQVRHPMSDSKSIEFRLLWFPFLIHTAFLVLLSPLAYWTAACILVGHFDFGMALAVLVGLPGTYLFFGCSLLVASLGTTAATVWVARLASAWQRLVGGTVVGVAMGTLLGAYIALKLARDGAAISRSSSSGEFWDALFPGPIAGLVLGLMLSSLWRLACRWAGAVAREIAAPTAPPLNGRPATFLGSSGGSGGPPSVS